MSTENIHYMTSMKHTLSCEPPWSVACSSDACCSMAWWYAAQLWHVLFLFLQSSTIWKQMAGEKISEFLMVIKYTARKGSSHSGTMSSYIHYTNSTPLATSLMQCLCWRWITFYCCAGPKHCDWFALDWHISYMGNRMPRKKNVSYFFKVFGVFPMLFSMKQ